MKQINNSSLRNESFAEKYNLKIEKCEKCSEELTPQAVAWLELSNTDGNYYKKLPKGHISQGAFPFDRKCASNQLKETNHKAIIGEGLEDVTEILNDFYLATKEDRDKNWWNWEDINDFSKKHKFLNNYQRLKDSNAELLEALGLVVGSMSLERVERFDILEKCKSAINKAKSM